MADEQLTADNKRKLHDLNDDPLSDHLSIANGTPQSPLNAQDPEPKRPRFDHTPQKLEEATENGQHEKLPEELNEVNVEEVLVVEHNNEKEEGQEKVDEPVDKVNKESVVTDTSAVSQESGDKEEQRDAQPTSAGHPTSRKVDVPSDKVGVLIGKAGDTIRTLEQNSGARIHITRDSEADPGSVNRPVEIVGSLESINKAEKLIKDVIAEADAGGSPLLVARGFSHLQSSAAVEQVQIQVPNDKVKFIIGKRGEMIKNLQTKSGARIQCIPQHLPEGDQSKERTVRLTGDMRQIEMAKEMIKETITQTFWPAAPTSGYNQQNFNPRGPGSQWGLRSHSSQPAEYDHPQKRPYPSQNSHYSSQGYGNYPPQRPPSRNNFGWEQRPPTNMQGPPDHTGYDYYSGQGAHTPAASGPGPGPMMGPPPSQANYNYGQPKGPDYGQQPPPFPPQGYGQGYGEPKYDNQGPVQHPYGTHGPPPSYNAPQQGPYGQPYGQPRPSQPGNVPYQGLVPPAQSYGPNAPAQQQPYPYASSGSMQQGYTQYPVVSQQSGQPVSGYAQPGAPQQGPGYTQSGPTASYGMYPATQPGFTEQAPASNAGYGFQGAAYAGGPGTGYGPAVGPSAAYSQPAPIQPGYGQTAAPQAGGYGNVPITYGKSGSPQHQAPPVYAQYDNSQMYAGHR